MDISVWLFLTEWPSVVLTVSACSFPLHVGCGHGINSFHLHSCWARHLFSFLFPLWLLATEVFFLTTPNRFPKLWQLCRDICINRQGEWLKRKCCLGPSERCILKGVIENPCLQWTIMFESPPASQKVTQGEHKEWRTHWKPPQPSGEGYDSEQQ